MTLSQALKLSGMCSTGGQAKALIQDGQVKLNGQICRERGRKLAPGDAVEFSGRVFKVGAGGEKG